MNNKEFNAYNFKEISETLKNKIKTFVNKEDNDDRSLGIYGTWGTGKSTLIDSVSKDISNKIKIVRIELWEYELYQNDLDMIAKRVFEEIFEFSNPYQKKEIISKVISGALNITKIFGPFLGLPGKILENISKVFQKNDEEYKFLKLLKDKTLDKKVLIIFDEIDRCKKSKIEEYLNFIKHIVSCLSNNIKTAIVLDYKFTMDTLFGDKADSKNKDLFFEKIICDTFNIEEFLKMHRVNNDLDYWIDESIFEELVKENIMPRTRMTILNKVNDLYKELIEEEDAKFVR
ncbi:hypothetical protein SSABA_v1c04110 [Spiroplasma sabaudiense Ar-1343]|uniref:KAP NTPase domain-containing protein n=1 Tax=Spiroplasma sabaudiense Ar-1343 TaxID=1276257 RepID=W6AAF2_9MOLU|nr:P-loop NTPase fold protein [Spiroplasma sabaudiense]AHI53820.1 hypothetical protein SSABA_v1c04110 [Spiroplasma sabaudiense Ar-1343]